MRLDAGSRRVVLGSLIAASLVLGLAGLALARVVLDYWNAADYPGAAYLGSHSLYKFSPHLVIRRDTAYLTPDGFGEVYHFYSSGFNLGPEQHAQSACILMANSTTTMGLIETDMAVTLCDTPSGRMIFVMRAVSLRRR